MSSEQACHRKGCENPLGFKPGTLSFATVWFESMYILTLVYRGFKHYISLVYGSVLYNLRPRENNYKK